MNRTSGVRRVHTPRCPARGKRGTCNCGGGWQAEVYDASTGKKLRKTLPTEAEARAWRVDVQHGVRRGTVRAAAPVTVGEAADALFAGMKSGAIRNRSGDPYKPSSERSYREAFELHVRHELGAIRLGDVKRRHVQNLADELLAAGMSPSGVRNVLMPVRVIFKRAIRDELAIINPCTGLELPANRSKRPEIVLPEQAAALVAAIPDRRDRALWACAFYAGLRRGELMALRWRDVDTGNGVLHVERAWDPKERQYVEPKSRAGRRRVPIAGTLRDALLDLRASLDKIDPEALVFGDRDQVPFDDDALLARVRGAWAAAAVGAFLRGESLGVELRPVGLHVARHTYASLMIASGVNAKALSTFMGHASVVITLDRYGHLFPGSIDEAAGLLDAFLGRAGGLAGRHDTTSLLTVGSGRS